MNKKIGFTLTLMLFSLFSLAQLMGGLKGGLNYGDVVITNGKTYFEGTQFAPHASFHFGSFVQQDFSNSFAWKLEMLFSNKGYITKVDDVKATVSLNYLNWPILIVYHMSPNLNFETGVELGLLVTGDPLFNSFDMGIDLGMNYHISDKLNAGIRYNHGLPFKMNLEQIAASEIPTYQLSTLQVFLGFNIIHESEPIQKNN